jgi:quinol monooxygenase YgiN
LREYSLAKSTVQFTIDLKINDGQLEAFESLAKAMSAATQIEPGALTYAWYLSEDRKHCRLVEKYTDGNAVVTHLSGRVVEEFVPKLLAVSKLTRFEVHGDPGPKAGAMLAGFGAEIFRHWQGFDH